MTNDKETIDKETIDSI